jgi:hypothetical protein
MVFRRVLGEETYTISLNFSFRKIKLSKKIKNYLSGNLAISSAGREAFDGTLLPWEGVVVKTQ